MWQDQAIGLHWQARVHNTFILPTLLFIAQLEAPDEERRRGLAELLMSQLRNIQISTRLIQAALLRQAAEALIKVRRQRMGNSISTSRKLEIGMKNLNWSSGQTTKLTAMSKGRLMQLRL